MAIGRKILKIDPVGIDIGVVKVIMILVEV